MRGLNVGKNRLEAFSDGVLAIIITIMVLEMEVPRGDALGIVATFWWPWVGQALYVPVALLGLVPDRRMERSLHADGG